MMKLTTGLLLILFCSDSFAQTKKGNFALSGKSDLNFLFSNNKFATDSIETGRTKTNQYGFTAGIGYFVADDFMIGLSGSFAYNDTRIEPNNQFGAENITTTFGIIPQLTYYFPVDGNLRPSVSLGAGYLWVREIDSRILDNNNLLNSFSGLSLNGAAGVSYFINESVSFDLGVQYTRNRLKNKLQTNQVQIQNMMSGNIGLTVFF